MIACTRDLPPFIASVRPSLSSHQSAVTCDGGSSSGACIHVRWGSSGVRQRSEEVGASGHMGACCHPATGSAESIAPPVCIRVASVYAFCSCALTSLWSGEIPSRLVGRRSPPPPAPTRFLTCRLHSHRRCHRSLYLCGGSPQLRSASLFHSADCGRDCRFVVAVAGKGEASCFRFSARCGRMPDADLASPYRRDIALDCCVLTHVCCLVRHRDNIDSNHICQNPIKRISESEPPLRVLPSSSTAQPPKKSATRKKMGLARRVA